MILTCTCKSTFQDGRYGKNKRVYNQCGSDAVNHRYRCSICGTEKNKAIKKG